MGVGGPADALASPAPPRRRGGSCLSDGAGRAQHCGGQLDQPHLPLRGLPGGFDLCLRRMRTIRLEGIPPERRITAQAGALLSELVGLCTEKAWGGPGLCRRHPGSLGGPSG
jgi:hypothetical protein